MNDRRRFLGWKSAALPAAVAVLAEEYVVGDRLDMAGAAVVLPGARAGRRLKELLVDEAARRSLRLVPPAVLTVGALPDLLCDSPLPPADAETCRRVWIRLLRQLSPDQRAMLFPRAPEAGNLPAWFHLADVLAGLHRTLGAAGLRFDAVAERTKELYDDSGRWSVLARLQREYARELEQLGTTDRELSRMHAAATGAITSDRDIWLVGVAELPMLHRDLLRRLDPERLRVLVHAPADMAARFDDLGCVVVDEWIYTEIELREDQVAIVGHPSNQANEAAAALARLGGRYAADEVVIGVPDAEVVPALERHLASAGIVTRYVAGEGDEKPPEFRLLTAGVPARYAAGVPIERSPGFRLLKAIADLIRDQSYEAAAALVRHPAFGEWLTRRRWDVDHAGAAAFRQSDGWLADLDAFLCERLPRSLTGELGGVGGRGRSVAEALRLALLGERMLGSLTGTRPLREWMRPILTLVLEIYGERALHRHDREEQQLLAFARRLREVATSFEQVPSRLDDVCDAATAIQLVLDQIAGDALPPEADEVAVELLGWLELHLDDAPVAILTGMNEPFVPEALNADAFLPNRLRSLLGIEDNDRRYARDAYQLTAMLNSRHVHVVAGRRTILGDPLRPSRLLLATTGSVLARRIRGFLEEDASVGNVPSIMPDSGSSVFQLPPDPVISLPEVPTALHVTGFGAVLKDPYRWALDRLIGGDIVEDAVRELDPRRFGTLAHRVLQEFGRTPAASSDDEQLVREALDECLDHWVETHFGAVFPAARLQIEQLRMRLHRFAAEQARRIAEGWRTVGVECGTPEEGVPLLVDDEIFHVTGRIDRIDYHEERGEWAVFDYKTGERGEEPGKARLKNGEWKDLQLPLYNHILPHVVREDGTRVFTRGGGSTISLGYALLCADPERIGFVEAEWTEPDLDAAMEAARDVVRTLRENRFRFESRENRWDDPDVKELLGFGRLALAEEEETEEVQA